MSSLQRKESHQLAFQDIVQFLSSSGSYLPPRNTVQGGVPGSRSRCGAGYAGAPLEPCRVGYCTILYSEGKGSRSRLRSPIIELC